MLYKNLVTKLAEKLAEKNTRDFDKAITYLERAVEFFEAVSEITKIAAESLTEAAEFHKAYRGEMTKENKEFYELCFHFDVRGVKNWVERNQKAAVERAMAHYN